MVSPNGGLSPGLDVRPGAHVLVFLLDPAQLGVTVMLRHLQDNMTTGNFSAASHLLHDIKWEGADLFNGVDGNLVLQASVSPLFYQVVVDFTSAKQNLDSILHSDHLLSRHSLPS